MILLTTQSAIITAEQKVDKRQRRNKEEVNELEVHTTPPSTQKGENTRLPNIPQLNQHPPSNILMTEQTLIEQPTIIPLEENEISTIIPTLESSGDNDITHEETTEVSSTVPQESTTEITPENSDISTTEESYLHTSEIPIERIGDLTDRVNTDLVDEQDIQIAQVGVHTTLIQSVVSHTTFIQLAIPFSTISYFNELLEVETVIDETVNSVRRANAELNRIQVENPLKTEPIATIQAVCGKLQLPYRQSNSSISHIQCRGIKETMSYSCIGKHNNIAS